VSTETTEEFRNLPPETGEFFAADRLPGEFFDDEGNVAEIVPIGNGIIGAIDAATLAEPFFGAFNAVEPVGEGSTPFLEGATRLGVDGEFAFFEAFNGFVQAGQFIQSGDTTLLFVGTQEGRTLDVEVSVSATGEGFGAELNEAAEAEIARELANAASENSRGGTTITPEERDTATIEGLAVAADSLASGLFIGQTGGEEDGSTLLTRVDPSEDANLLSSDDTSDDTSDDNDSRERAPRRTTIRTRQRRGAVTAGF
jgi:hypothetical protein